MVYATENGVDAMQLIRRRETDLAILNIRMQEMSGIDMLMRN
jgi:two-component SAPR family response regulator